MDFDNKKVRLEEISLQLDGRKIFEHTSLVIEKEKITLILGKSGSGKSTLLNIMNMLYVPDKGRYYFEGKKVEYENEDMISEVRKRIGYFHQELALMEGLTVEENLEIFSIVNQNNMNKKVVEKYLKLLDIEKKYTENVSCLSGGERQRAAFMKLLIFPYEMVFIDEPTNNLDSQNIQYILSGIQELKKQKKTVVVVSHYEPLQKIADNIIRMEEINEK